MTKVIHGTVHKGMIKPGDVLEENEEVLIVVSTNILPSSLYPV